MCFEPVDEERRLCNPSFVCATLRLGSVIKTYTFVLRNPRSHTKKHEFFVFKMYKLFTHKSLGTEIRKNHATQSKNRRHDWSRF